MRNRTIDTIARDLAEPRARYSGEPPKLDPAAAQSAVLADIRMLISAEAIAPIDPVSTLSVATGADFDGSWLLSRHDLERVRQYTWRNDHALKHAYLSSLNTGLSTGRYTLFGAAEALQVATGEHSNHYLEKLKLAAFEGQIPVFGPNQRQQYVYQRDGKRVTHARASYEEAHWHDLNVWLKQHEPHMTYRFPMPSNAPPIDADESQLRAAKMNLDRSIKMVGNNGPAGGERSPLVFQQAWPWQEDQVIRSARALGYDPLSLPKDDRKTGFFVKSLIRIRCAKNSPTKMRKSLFDKAWDRMLASTPPTLKYADDRNSN